MMARYYVGLDMWLGWGASDAHLRRFFRPLRTGLWVACVP